MAQHWLHLVGDIVSRKLLILTEAPIFNPWTEPDWGLVHLSPLDSFCNLKGCTQTLDNNWKLERPNPRLKPQTIALKKLDRLGSCQSKGATVFKLGARSGISKGRIYDTYLTVKLEYNTEETREDSGNCPPTRLRRCAVFRPWRQWSFDRYRDGACALVGLIFAGEYLVKDSGQDIPDDLLLSHQPEHRLGCVRKFMEGMLLPFGNYDHTVERSPLHVVSIGICTYLLYNSALY